jgi:hypothetical protein
MANEEEINFSEIVSEAFPNQMISNWIVIAEIVTETDRYLAVDTSDEVSFWLATGMLKCAKDIIEEDHYTLEFEGTEDGE